MMEDLSADERKFLKILETSLSPFEKFVAKYDIEEKLPLVTSRKREFFALLRHAIKELPTQIIPIVGQTGVGKTYVLWELKKSLEIRSPTVFLEVPGNAEKFYYDIFTQIVEEVGIATIREITSILSDKWGASQRKYGLFRIMNTQLVIDRAKETARYIRSSHKKELEQCIKVIVTHSMDPEKQTIAERWLLGDKLDLDDLFFLGVESDLTGPYIAEELFKMIIDYLPEGVLLVFDDIDKNWTRFNVYSHAETDWTESDDEEEENNTMKFKQSLEDVSMKSFFDYLIAIIENLHKVKIIITANSDTIQETLAKFPKRWQNTIRSPLYIPNFSIEDAKEYYIAALQEYSKNRDIPIIPNKPFFPLNEALIIKAFEYANGNPRQLIRNFQKLFDALVFDDMTLNEIEAKAGKLLK